MFARWCPKHGASLDLVTKCNKMHANSDNYVCHQEWRQKSQGCFVKMHTVLNCNCHLCAMI